VTGASSGIGRALALNLSRRGCMVGRVEEPAFAGANGAWHLAQGMPAEFWNQFKG